MLFDPENSTIAVRVDPNTLRLRRPQPPSSSLHPEKTMELVVRGMVERVVYQEGTEIVLGRADCFTANPRHIDLTRYGGQDKGVSRTHATLAV